MNKLSPLSRRIMRRTYYAYVIHMMTRPLVRFGLPLVVLTFVLAKLVYVAAVFANAQSAGLAQLPSFTLTALVNADSLTLVSFAALGFILIGLARDLALALQSRDTHKQYAQ